MLGTSAAAHMDEFENAHAHAHVHAALGNMPLTQEVAVQTGLVVGE